MSEASSGPRTTDLNRQFPWLRLPRSLALACDARKLILAAFGVVSLWMGWDGLDRLFPASADMTPAMNYSWPGGASLGSIEPATNAVGLVSDPVRIPAAPFVALFDLPNDGLRLLHAALAFLWALIVWGLVGCAICRIVVGQAARGERLGIAGALRYSLGKMASLVGGPLGPLAGVAFLCSGCALVGLIYRIPGAGASIAGALAFLPLLAALLITLILVGLAAGWPLIIASIAAEANDGFDAVSRSYSYVYQRPGRYFLYVVFSWAIGVLGVVFVGLFARMVLHLAAWSLAFGAPDATVMMLFDPALRPATLASRIHFGWVAFVMLLAYGWVYAYFWTAMTQIYLLLRLDVDGAPLDDVSWPVPAPLFSDEPATEPTSVDEPTHA